MAFEQAEAVSLSCVLDTTTLRENLQKDSTIHAMVLDLKKAFDKVLHNMVFTRTSHVERYHVQHLMTYQKLSQTHTLIRTGY